MIKPKLLEETTPSGLEEELSNWLKTNPFHTIESVNYAIGIDEDQCFYSVLIFYREQEKVE